VTEENELFLKMFIVPAKMGIVPTNLSCIKTRWYLTNNKERSQLGLDKSKMNISSKNT